MVLEILLPAALVGGGFIVGAMTAIKLAPLIMDKIEDPKMGAAAVAGVNILVGVVIAAFGGNIGRWIGLGIAASSVVALATALGLTARLAEAIG